MRLTARRLALTSGGTQIRKEPVRFDSFRLRTFRKLIGPVRFGSVRTNSFTDSTRFGLRFFRRAVARSGSVPLPLPVPPGSGIKRFGSVRPVWFSFLFLPVRSESHRVQKFEGVSLYGGKSPVKNKSRLGLNPLNPRISRFRFASWLHGLDPTLGTANLPPKILDFRGFDSRIILFLRGRILMSTGDLSLKA